ncbi:MAG TPA: TilS substrate-binding domain-containing protein, partial [Actinomycetes bacterium]|nr:TilS substrate-binding domain-containing protein [Actinomycetes bacterium]
DCARLAQLPAAIRRRIIRNGALAVGVTPGSLRQSHLAAVDVLVTDWQGQGPVDLPGGVVADRDCGRLRIVLGRTPPPTGAIRDHGQE